MITDFTEEELNKFRGFCDFLVERIGYALFNKMTYKRLQHIYNAEDLTTIEFKLVLDVNSEDPYARYINNVVADYQPEYHHDHWKQLGLIDSGEPWLTLNFDIDDSYYSTIEELPNVSIVVPDHVYSYGDYETYAEYEYRVGVKPDDMLVFPNGTTANLRQ